MSFKKRPKNCPISCHVVATRLLNNAFVLEMSPTKESKKIAGKEAGTSSIKRSFEGDNCLS